MKICHRYRDLIDSSFSNKINDWELYNDVNENFKIFNSKDDKTNKLAVKTIYGLFAKDIAYTFWNIDESVKLEWDQSIQSMKVLEVLSPNCAILHLKMKRIWPAKARDCVICTELVQIGEYEWVVTNISVNHPLTQVVPSEYTRMYCKVNMFVKESLIDKNKERTRDNIVSTINFKANIDVGNWITNGIVSKMCHTTWSSALDSLCETVTKNIV